MIVKPWQKVFITLLVLGFIVACPSSPPQPVSNPRTLSITNNMIQTDRGLVFTFGVVSFETGRAELTPMVASRIGEIAEFIHQTPYNVLIEGHTDNTGDANYNQWLSEQRAIEVKNALIARGVSPLRLSAVGYGESRPAASNEHEFGRQQNRRVDVIILNR